MVSIRIGQNCYRERGLSNDESNKKNQFVLPQKAVL